MALLCGCPLLLLLQKADWAVCSRGQRSNSSCQKQIGGEPQGGVKGQWPVDCPRYDGPGGGRGRLHRAAPMNYEENQWRQEVTRGGQAISSAPGDLFWHWEEKRKKKWRKREEKCDQQGAVFLRILQFKRRVSHHWELFENTSVEVKNKSTTRYEAQAHNCYVTKLKKKKNHERPWTISGSSISENVCADAISTPAEKSQKSKVQQACERSSLLVTTPSSTVRALEPTDPDTHAAPSNKRLFAILKEEPSHA